MPAKFKDLCYVRSHVYQAFSTRDIFSAYGYRNGELRISVFSRFIWTLYQLLKNFYYSLTEKWGNRDNAVSIATGYGLDDRGVGVQVPVGSRILSTSFRPALGPTQPPVEWVPRTLSPALKRQGREADHSPPASAEVKKMWIYTSIPLYAFMALCVIS
jgi:hypothetical protein